MKVIASDFDNTLYTKDEETFKNNIESVRNFISRGNKFLIITGRSYSNISKVIKEYDIPYSFLVCQDGANIFDKDGNCIKSHDLDIEKKLLIRKCLLENKIEYSYESAFNDNDTIDNSQKITITLHEGNDSSIIVNDIKSITDVYAYTSSKHINIIDSYVNKSMALKYLINNNLINNNVTVLGDDINDYEMMKEFHGMVMKKHDPILDELKKEEINSVGEYLNTL